MALTRQGSSRDTKGHLLRILGVGFGIAVIVGNTIGVGILRTPGEIAARLQSSGLVITLWVLGGLYAFFCTLSVTELGTMLPQAGGWYVYSRRAFGNYGGFLVGCSDWIVQAASLAYGAVAFGEFTAELQPAFRGSVKLVAIAAAEHPGPAELARFAFWQSRPGADQSGQGTGLGRICSRMFRDLTER